jgi:uncharacterized protein (DUF2147 family)
MERQLERRLGRRLMFVMTAGFALLAGAQISVAAEPTAAGLWQKTEDGKPVIWVLMTERNGIFAPPPGDSASRVCAKCEDDRKDAPVLGLSFIRGMKRNGLSYEGGNVLDPRDGKVYDALLSVSSDGQSMTLRGYLGIPLFGMNETWTRLPDSAMAQLDPTIAAKYGVARSARKPGEVRAQSELTGR